MTAARSHRWSQEHTQRGRSQSAMAAKAQWAACRRCSEFHRRAERIRQVRSPGCDHRGPWWQPAQALRHGRRHHRRARSHPQWRKFLIRRAAPYKVSMTYPPPGATPRQKGAQPAPAPLQPSLPRTPIRITSQQAPCHRVCERHLMCALRAATEATGLLSKVAIGPTCSS